MTITKQIEVTQVIEVTIDESKFDEEFMAEFDAHFFPGYDLNDHFKHLAQLFARGICDGDFDNFIEGYGVATDMGIRFRKIDGDEEILTPPIEQVA